MLQRDITIGTKGFGDTVDLTDQAAQFIEESGIEAGHLNLFVSGSTAGLTTIEFESGVLEDLKQALERMAPMGIPYHHDERWGDGNGFSHVRAALVGPSLTIPFSGARLLLGTWQQVVLLDFDNRSRERTLILSIA